MDIKIENRYRTIKDEGKTDFWAINIINTNASKGNAMTGLCKYLKIDSPCFTQYDVMGNEM